MNLALEHMTAHNTCEAINVIVTSHTRKIYWKKRKRERSFNGMYFKQWDMHLIGSTESFKCSNQRQRPLMWNQASVKIPGSSVAFFFLSVFCKAVYSYKKSHTRYVFLCNCESCSECPRLAVFWSFRRVLFSSSFFDLPYWCALCKTFSERK